MFCKKNSFSPSKMASTPEVFPEPYSCFTEAEESSEMEQRICDFLDSNQIFSKSPVDKMYDYFDKKREEMSKSTSMLSLNSTPNRGKFISCDEGQWGMNEERGDSCFDTPMKNRKLHLTLSMRKNNSNV